ncbi:hypothetical protein XU18_4108 [Perkinsela sp. CCAP 1560/4]|nr:hypothetical protein XU18_4108 [Perkinsela sp. CCAP 1560/4]|eukprot:KNH04696.1 hypothetical protein XU18_4108 [Perkinsela sp. CCAP 1560/4]
MDRNALSRVLSLVDIPGQVKCLPPKLQLHNCLRLDRRSPFRGALDSYPILGEVRSRLNSRRFSVLGADFIDGRRSGDDRILLGDPGSPWWRDERNVNRCRGL